MLRQLAAITRAINPDECLPSAELSNHFKTHGHAHLPPFWLVKDCSSNIIRWHVLQNFLVIIHASRPKKMYWMKCIPRHAWLPPAKSCSLVQVLTFFSLEIFLIDTNDFNVSWLRFACLVLFLKLPILFIYVDRMSTVTFSLKQIILSIYFPFSFFLIRFLFLFHCLKK